MKPKILTITMIALRATLSLTVIFLLLGQAMVGGTDINPCPDLAAATDAWHKDCPGSEGASGCTDTYYKDGAGNLLSTVCGPYVGQLCCPMRTVGPVTKYVGNYLCTLWGDQCDTNSCIFTTQTTVPSVLEVGSYNCSTYTNCPPRTD
jgi:hypothetical protein